MKRRELKYVYLHLDNSGNVFYVGCGNKARPFNSKSRSEEWKEMAKKGYSVEIVDVLTRQRALNLEKKLIKKYQSKKITNKTHVDKINFLGRKVRKFSFLAEVSLVEQMIELSKKEQRGLSSQFNFIIKRALEARKLKTK